MMRAPHDRAALLLQVETYDLQGVDHYKLMLVWRETATQFTKCISLRIRSTPIPKPDTA